MKNTSGIVAVTKTGNGTIVLSGNNNYSGLTKVLAGTLTLSGNNSSAIGGVTLTGGTLDIDSQTALGSGTFTINGGAIDNISGGDLVLSTNNVQAWDGDFTFNGTHSLDLGTGGVTLNAGCQITVNAMILSVGGDIGGGFGLTKTGAGNLDLYSSAEFLHRSDA